MFRAALKIQNSLTQITHKEKHSQIHDEAETLGSTRVDIYEDHKVELKG